MPIETLINKETRLIIRKITEEFNFEDIKSSFEASIRNPDFHKNMPVIWDLRNADASKLSEQNLQQIIDYIEKSTESRGAGYKVALVASRDLEYGVSRMYEAMGYDLPRKIQVFREFDKAERWVIESDTDK